MAGVGATAAAFSAGDEAIDYLQGLNKQSLGDVMAKIAKEGVINALGEGAGRAIVGGAARLIKGPGPKYSQARAEEISTAIKEGRETDTGLQAIKNVLYPSPEKVGKQIAQEEALADMMSAVAEHFLEMATKIIAQQLAMILYGTIMKALGVSMPKGAGFGGPNLNVSDSSPFDLDKSFFAEGGFVNKPTNAIIGEGSEPEYVIPESKMKESMMRYSRGARGNSVIPESGEGGASGEGSGTAVAAPIDVRYSVERINNVDYVTADQFQAGMRQAAQQGAKQGEQQTLRRLQMSSSTRRRLGV